MNPFARSAQAISKGLCALIKKHQEIGSIELETISGRPDNTTLRQEQILVLTSFADRHLTFPDTGSLAAIQTRNPAAFGRLLIVLEGTHRWSLPSVALCYMFTLARPL